MAECSFRQVLGKHHHLFIGCKLHLVALVFTEFSTLVLMLLVSSALLCSVLQQRHLTVLTVLFHDAAGNNNNRIYIVPWCERGASEMIDIYYFWNDMWYIKTCSAPVSVSLWYYYSVHILLHCAPKNETWMLVILNTLYRKSVAMKFINPDTLGIKHIHNLPPHLSYVSTLPDITQKLMLSSSR